MKKKDYRQEIHRLFEKVRNEIKVESEVSVLRLQSLDRMESRLIEENSRDALKEIKKYIRKEKQRTYILSYAGKKFTVLSSGKIRVENLPPEKRPIDILNSQ